MKPHIITALLLSLLFALGFPSLAHSYYNPSTGRWLNRDPIERRPDESLYAIAGNNPVQLLDFLGLKTLDFTAEGRTFADGTWDVFPPTPAFTVSAKASGEVQGTSAWFFQFASVDRGGVLLCNSTLQAPGAHDPSSFVVARVVNRSSCQVYLDCHCIVTYNIAIWTSTRQKVASIRGHVLGKALNRDYPPVGPLVGAATHRFWAGGTETVEHRLGFSLGLGAGMELYYVSPQLALAGNMTGEGFFESADGSCTCVER